MVICHMNKVNLLIYHKTSLKVRPSRGLLGVTAKETAARVSRHSEALRGFQGNAAGTGVTQSIIIVSSKLRDNPASQIAHQVGTISHFYDYRLILPGLNCSVLSVLVDQGANGPMYALQTVMARPYFPHLEISAVSLVI